MRIRIFMNGDIERIRARKEAWFMAFKMYYSGICLEGLRETV
jgi:hypothetical protein